MRLFLPILAIVCLLLVACTEDAKPPKTVSPSPSPPPVVVDHSSDPWRIVVSLPIFADMAKIIVGDQGTVTSLIPPGEDPQTYVPSDDLAQKVSDAQLIFYNGLGLETPTQQFIQAHQTQPVLAIAFAHNVPSPSTQQPLDKPIYAEQVGDDPHLFLDPVLARVYPETIADSMVIKDGQNAAYYNARYTKYKDEIAHLDEYIRGKMSTIPPANRGLIVSDHGSLVHYAKRYGLGIAGTLVDKGQDGLAQVISTQQPPAVFTETGYDPAPLQTLAQNAGIQVCNLDTDALSDPNISFIEMMSKDADTISRCLGGS
jgi:ABC-type Zn uptake system ZnuABC Zn-binding protein ZnuA